MQSTALTTVRCGVPGDGAGLAEAVGPAPRVVVPVVDVAVERGAVGLDVLVELDAPPDVPQAARTAITIAMPAATITRFTIRSLSAPLQRVIGCEEGSVLRRSGYPR